MAEKRPSRERLGQLLYEAGRPEAITWGGLGDYYRERSMAQAERFLATLEAEGPSPATVAVEQGRLGL